MGLALEIAPMTAYVRSMGKIVRYAPWLVLGPVTGPLAARGLQVAQAGDRFLALLYGAAILLWWINLSAAGDWAVRFLAAHG